MSRPSRWSILGLLVFALGAAPPEVVRLRVPSQSVSKWFPPGTELKGISAADFETLFGDALSGSRTTTAEDSPRLLRTSHTARWQNGLLVGRSELIVEPPRTGSGSLVLEPWTPAIDPKAGGSSSIRADSSGQTLLRIKPPAEPGKTATAVIDWQLQARDGSKGRKFALALPGSGPSELKLDLPEGLEPEGLTGLRRGSASDDGRVRWIFAGPVGRCDLLLVDSTSKADPLGDPGLWVAGPIRIDIEESVATWILDGSVSSSPGAPKRLVLSLDSSLDLVAVNGPAVDDYWAEANDDGSTRLTIRLRSPVGAVGKIATRFSVRALTSVPSEGRWVVPAARPVNAVWTGGTTTVHVGTSRVIEAVHPLAGRRIAAPANGLADDHRLDFAADRPTAVAELVFHKPRADASAEIHGLLMVGSTSPRLTCRLVWKFHKGRPHSLEVDLPRAWVADRIEIEGNDEPVSWHSEDLPEGGSRVHVSPPSDVFADRSLVLNVSVISTIAGGLGPLALPRVKPVGARVSDEVWVARLESGMSLRPILARGLAWLDPAAFDREPTLAAPAVGMRAALAWRWTEEEAEARVERERNEPAPRGTVELVADVAPDRLKLDARLSITPRDEPVRSIALGLSEPVSDPGSWRFFEESTSQELSHKPLSAEARTAAGDLGRGPAWRIDLPHPQRGARIALTAHYEGRWNGRGPIPLIVMPAQLRARGTVLVVTARDVWTSATTREMRVLDPEITAESLANEGGSSSEPGSIPNRRHADAFAYDSAEARLELTAEALTPVDSGGLIREATLTTLVNPQGGIGRNRLSLRIVPDGATALEITLPPGSIPERIVRDGHALTPTTRSGQALSIPLIATNSSRPLVVVTLDYRQVPSPSSTPTRLRPERPGFSMPCLSLAWELVVPDSWQISEWGGALTPSDPSDTHPGFLDRLTSLRPDATWSWRRSVGRDAEADKMLRDFHTRIMATRSEETSLGEWFTRLDAGRWPMVIDRLAIASAGWGPRSRIVPPRSLPATETLQSLGLTVMTVGHALLITTHDRAPADLATSPEWSSTVRDAAAWGADSSDRFQSVSRWREEATPRITASDPFDSPGSGAGRTVKRFFASGWPVADVDVRLTNCQQKKTVMWVFALAVLTLGLACRSRSRAFRVSLNTALIGLSLIATATVPLWLLGVSNGLLMGSFALALLGLGEALPALRRLRRREPRSTLSHSRRGADFATRSLLAISTLAVAAPWALSQTLPSRDAVEPILVLFPYDGPPDPTAAPDRGLLRLTDYERLRALADQASIPPKGSLVASDARHRILERAAGRAATVVETELTLLGLGRGSAVWTFPIDAAREITATLDGKHVPVRVEQGARSASVPVDVRSPDQTFHLMIRRSVTPRQGDWGESITLSVNPVATAWVEVDGHPDGLRARVPSALGRMEDRADKLGPAGRLGPAPLIEVRWVPPGGEDSLPSAGAVEGLYLWDATHAGDLVRTRLTYRDQGGTGIVRFALGRGVLVRDFTIPGTVDVSREGTSDHPQWVARISPPLADGATISVDVFRPHTAAPDQPGHRSAPRIEPIGVERSTGVLAFRRPTDWVGRLVPAEDAEAYGEETFVRAWGGSLPDEPLTLSGALKLPASSARESWPEVVSGPAAASCRVEPTLHLSIASGRIDMIVDAELTETAGPVYDLEINAAEGFRPVRVIADGLTDWTMQASRLKLRFDGPPLHQRRVHVEGWLAVAADPLTPGSVGQTREIAVPWPRWGKHIEQAGLLTVEGPTRFSLVGSGGSTLISTEPGPPTRMSYRVNRPDDLGQLRWEVKPPRVSVQVQNQLTIDLNTADWLAVLRYDVSDGPLDAIILKLPTDWARTASAWLDGVRHIPKSEVRRDPETRRESTYWTIRPHRPVWGSQRLVLRSTLPFVPGESRSFPDISPLGWGGAVDISLRLINATRQPISIERLPGLQQIASQSFPSNEEVAAVAPQTSSVTSYCYRVVRSGWSLRVQKPASSTPGDGQGIAHGELTCTLAADGSVLGCGRYEVGPRSGPFLRLKLPGGSLPLWASINGTQAHPLDAGEGRWQIPLAEESVSRIVLIWRSAPPDGLPSLAPHPIPLPIVGQGHVPVVVTLRTPTGIEVSSPSGRLAPCGLERVELEKARWLVDETASALTALDRSSRRDAENLVAALVKIELFFRSAERAATLDPRQRSERSSLVDQVIQRLRNRLTEAVQTEALDEFQSAARSFLGLIPEPSGSSIPPTPESPSPMQIRPLGHPQAFQGVLDATNSTPSLAWTLSRDPATNERRWLLGLVLFLGLAPIAAWFVTLRSAHLRHLGRIALTVGLAFTALWAGPLWLSAGIGLAILGRISRV